MSREGKLVKNTLVLSIGTFLPKAVSFITLPILTGYLTKAEYGTYDLITVLVALILPAATLQIQAAAFRFLIEVRDKIDDSPRNSLKSKKNIHSKETDRRKSGNLPPNRQVKKKNQTSAKKSTQSENIAAINRCIANNEEPKGKFKICAVENDFNTVKVYIKDSGFKIFCCKQNADDSELIEIYPMAQGFTDTGLDYIMNIFDIDFDHNVNKVIKPCIVAKTIYDYYELRERGKVYAE